MLCSACGTDNDAGRRFCDTCGAPLSIACRMCGSSNRPTARFCGDCGTPLESPGADGQIQARPVVTEPPLAQAERRLVSVLFVDLVGYTTLADGWDPEQARDLLTRYFETARDIVARYGGTIEKFIGDAVMAVWGAPTAHEDDAERAVRAALELVDRVPGLEPSLLARAGVLTGEAAVTLGATNQGMVAGDLVNTASRLQSVAPPGTVLVDEATERTASKAIAFEPAGEQLLKGKASPVPAYRAMRVVAERGGRNRSETLEAPFTGRDTELRLLKDLYAATARERRIALVSLTGQAGVGKSRVAWEFEKYLDGLVDTIRWHAGRSPAYGDGITFWALGEMVRGRAGLLATDDETTTRSKVAESVATWVPDESERRWIETALLALLAVEPAPPGGRESLFAAWRTYFERIGSQGTAVVLLFEDLHWADPGPPRLHRPPARVVDRRADPDRHPCPPGAPRTTPCVGRGPAELRRAPPRSAARRRGRRIARRPRHWAPRSGRSDHHPASRRHPALRGRDRPHARRRRRLAERDGIVRPRR